MRLAAACALLGVVGCGGNAGTGSTVDTLLTGGPDALSTLDHTTFFFESNVAGASFECQLDGSAPLPCASPASLEQLGQGPHVFLVTAAVGSVVDPTPARWQWAVDSVPPSTTLTRTPDDPSRLASAEFELASSESGSTFLCGIDGAALSSCASPFISSSLSDGEHRFVAIAVDAAGNRDPAPPIFTWQIDSTAPQTTITTTLGSLSYTTDAAFHLSSSEPGSFRCALDGASLAPCAADVAYAGLSEGTHTFVAASVDAAGNVDPVPPSFTWRVHVPWQLVTKLDGVAAGAWSWVAALGPTIYVATSASSSTQTVTFDTGSATWGMFASSDWFCPCGLMSTLVAAGGKLFGFANSAVSYDPASDSWADVPYPYPDGEWGIANLGGEVYLLGGRSSPHTLRVFDPISSAWSTAADFPRVVYAPKLAAASGLLFAFGGVQYGPDTKMDAYDPTTDTWQALSDAPFWFYGGSYTSEPQLQNGRIFVQGTMAVTDPVGQVWHAFDGYHIYDPATDSWDPLVVPPPATGDGTGGSNLALVATTTGLYLVGDALYGDSPALTLWKFVPP